MTEKILQMLDLTPLDVQMILIGAVLFFIFLKLLERSLFVPYMTLVDARESSTVGATEEALKTTSQAETLRAKYEEQSGLARRQAMQEKAEKVEKAKKGADAILHEAEGRAEEIVRAAKLEAAKYIESNSQSVQGQATELSELLVARIMQ